MKILVLTTFLAVAFAELGPSGYQYGNPHSSYDAPQSSITASPNFFQFSQTSPSPSFRLPIHEPQDFGAQVSNLGSFGLSTPAPFLNARFSTPAPLFNAGFSNPAPFGFQFTTPAPSVEVNNEGVSSTPAPQVEVTSAGTPSPVEIDVSSTPSPIEVSTAAPSLAPGPFLGGGSFGLGFNPGLVSSTPAPGLLNSFRFNLPQQNAFNFGINSYSTPAPVGQFSAGSLIPIDASLFSRDAALNGVQVTTSGGSLSESFGVSTAAPDIVLEEAVPELQKNVYYFAAPDEPEPVRPLIRIATPAPAKKNVNYIFVKAPAPAPVAPLRIVTQPKQHDKTVVYVLVKKPQEEQDIELQTPEPSPTPKPEVFFIKYKNQQEAEEAIAKVQTGQSAQEEHVAANNVGEGSSFVGHLDRANYRSQPIVNYVKSSNVVPQAPIFYSTTAAPYLNQGYSFSTPAPNFNGLAFSTVAPTVNAYSNSLPQLQQYGSLNFRSNLPIASGFQLGAGLVNALPDASQNLVDAQFASSTVAPDSLVSSTIEPASFASSTPAPFVLSGQQQSGLVNSPFSVYGAPSLIKKKK